MDDNLYILIQWLDLTEEVFLEKSKLLWFKIFARDISLFWKVNTMGVHDIKALH